MCEIPQPSQYHMLISQKLCRDFCPPLEEATLRAISFDYDLESSEELRACIQTLNLLMSDTAAENATGFDPSGTSGPGTQDSGIGSESQSINLKSQDVSSETVSSDQEDPFATSQNLDGASVDAKTAWLVEMFPDERIETIASRLERCSGNITRTIEELLNPTSTNAVDAFALDDDQQVRSKRNRRRRRPASYSSEEASSVNFDYDMDHSTPGQLGKTRRTATPKVKYAPVPGLDIGRKYAPLDVEAVTQGQKLGNKISRPDTARPSTGRPAQPRPFANIVDLHGYTVSEAVRIATDEIWAWWEGLGDRKYASGGGGPVREGFRFVTGVGNHSVGGRPKIRPAVAHRLVKDGWKVSVQEGEVLVTGRVRRS